MRFTNTIDTIGKGVDVVGVATIVVGVVAATVLSLRQPMDAASRYRVFRKRMGRAILLGLELLVAARWPWSPNPATNLGAADNDRP